MNFDFSEDQRRLQAEVRRVLADYSTSANVRAVLEGKTLYCAETWRQLAALGALGVALPEAQGGVGLGLLELCLVAEEAGRALAAVPLLSSVYLAAEALRRAGSPAQQALWLPRLASGEVIGTAALSGAAHRISTTPPPRREGDVLTGTLHAVPDGMAAEICVVLAEGRLALVALNGPGVSREAQSSLDPARPLARIDFSAAPATWLPGDGAAAARAVTLGVATLLAFEQIGGAEAALQMARDYVLQRRAFGRVVGGFQAVKHKLAEIYTKLELARTHAYFAAWALASGAPELPRAAAAARVAATTAYTLAAEEGLHLHGGIGFTWEMDCHLHLRRARWLGQIIGNEHLWRDALAVALIEEAA